MLLPLALSLIPSFHPQPADHPSEWRYERRDELAELVATLAREGDAADEEVVARIAALRTPAAAEALVAAYDDLSALFLRLEILAALPAFDGVEGEKVALQRLLDSATLEPERELRLAAVDALATCPTRGRQYLRMLVDSPADDEVRIRALERHVELATEADREWYRAILVPPVEEPRRKTPKSRREREAAENPAPDVPPLEALREVAFAALAPHLEPRELRELLEEERDPALRAAALASLHAAGDDEVVKLAEEMLESVRFPAEVRAAAARVLADVRGTRVADDFIDLARKQEVTPESLRETLAALCVAMGDEKVDAKAARLLGRGKPHERRFALLATRHVEDDRLDRKRLAALEDDDEDVWRAALTVVAERATEGAAEVLEEQLAEGEATERRLALLDALDVLYGEDPAWTARLAEWIDAPERDLRNRALRRWSERVGDAALERLVAALAHPDWSTRLTALEGLEALRSRAAVGALVARIGEERGRLLEAFADALWRLTGKPFRTRAAAWRDWWAAEGADFAPLSADALAALRAEDRERRLRQVTRVSFFGVRITSDRVAFVIDVSGSMLESLRGRYTHDAGEVRIEVARRELVRAIEGLGPETLFNVIPFSGGVTPWSDRVVAADEAGRARALEFVDRLGAGGGTNLFGALREAFADPEVDTIVVLSDGEPSVGDVVDTHAIRERVRRWNEDRGIEIHCVAVGGSLQILQWLAEDHGGTYVHFQ